MATLFKDLKQGHTVHFFNRKTADYQQGIIASDPSLPHFQANMPTMVVDVAITIGQDTKTYSIPETLSTTYYEDTCISTDLPSILREIDQLANQADAAIAALPTWEKVKQQCNDLRDTLNPEVKEKKLLDQRMTQLESNMSDMKDMFKEFMEKFK
ncbi:MAG: hypothetical protein KBS42_05165 [Bacteroidales bacterium]|nr:hypothetical protein [Candidatus Colicola coprequi]